MEGLAAVLAGPAAGHTLDYDLVRYLDGQGAVDVDARIFKSLRLGDRAGYTVEDVSAGAVRLGETLVDYSDDDLIGNELAAFHICLGFESHGRAVFHGSTEDIAGGNGGDIKHFAQDLCLSALACAGGAQKYKLHNSTSYSRKPL